MKDSIFPVLLKLQIPLIVIATTLLVVVGWKLTPLLERYDDLQHQVVALDSQIDAKKKTLEQLEMLIKTSNDAALRKSADEIIAGSSLQGYTVAIYCLSSDAKISERAGILATKLRDANLGAMIRVYPKDKEFLQTITAPDSDEIRFRPVDEDQGKALLEALKLVDPTHTYQLRPVSGKVSNFVSIFLRSDDFQVPGK